MRISTRLGRHGKGHERSVLPTLVLSDSAPEDLQAVPCATRKESGPDVTLAKTAGILRVCLSSGVIVLMQEIYGSESLA